MKHPNGEELPDEQLATHCGVSPHTVAKVRSVLFPTLQNAESEKPATPRKPPKPRKRKGADGRTINTANIGRKQAEPQAEPEQEPNQTPDEEPQEPSHVSNWIQNGAIHQGFYPSSRPNPAIPENDALGLRL